MGIHPVNWGRLEKITQPDASAPGPVPPGVGLIAIRGPRNHNRIGGDLIAADAAGRAIARAARVIPDPDRPHVYRDVVESLHDLFFVSCYDTKYQNIPAAKTSYAARMSWSQKPARRIAAPIY